jgi:hypothetical protein
VASAIIGSPLVQFSVRPERTLRCRLSAVWAYTRNDQPEDGSCRLAHMHFEADG